MKHEAVDSGAGAVEFNGEVMLRCPRCDSLAWSRKLDATSRDWFASRRLTCVKCANSKSWNERCIARARGERAHDDYFHLPLYLQVPCAGDVLWAYNLDHLATMRAWLQAPLRTRRRHAEFGWSNRSFLSRLPRWVKLAKNRALVSAALEKLGALALEPTAMPSGKRSHSALRAARSVRLAR